MRDATDDTRPEAADSQVALLRQASPARRMALALSLSQTVLFLAKQAIRSREPGLSDEEVGLRFVELHYGRALAAAVRDDLARRRS